MAVNKVVLDDNDLIDLTQDTVTPEDVMEGVTFHDASGNVQTGALNLDNYAEIDGSYSDLTAGKANTLINSAVMARQTTNLGWHKAIEIKATDINTSSGSYSALILVNGVRGETGETGIEPAGSGIIEIDTRINGTDKLFYSNRLKINILDGWINAQRICATFSEDFTTLNIYIYLPEQFMQYNLTKLGDANESSANTNIVTFVDEYYGTDAPANAVYAVNRNKPETAEMLSEPFYVGNLSDGEATTKYVKFATLTGLINWQQAGIRVEFVDDYVSNFNCLPCGINLFVMAGNSTSPVTPYAQLIYGNKQFLDKVYVSYDSTEAVSNTATVDLYFETTARFDVVCVKPLYVYKRNSVSQNWKFIKDNVLEDALPAGKTNTKVSELTNFSNINVSGAVDAVATATNSTPIKIQSGGVTTTIGDKNGAWTYFDTDADINGFGFNGHINALAGYSIYSADNGEVAYKNDLLDYASVITTNLHTNHAIAITPQIGSTYQFSGVNSKYQQLNKIIIARAAFSIFGNTYYFCILQCTETGTANFKLIECVPESSSSSTKKYRHHITINSVYGSSNQLRITFMLDNTQSSQYTSQNDIAPVLKDMGFTALENLLQASGILWLNGTLHQVFGVMCSVGGTDEQFNVAYINADDGTPSREAVTQSVMMSDTVQIL